MPANIRQKRFCCLAYLSRNFLGNTSRYIPAPRKNKLLQLKIEKSMTKIDGRFRKAAIQQSTTIANIKRTCLFDKFIVSYKNLLEYPTLYDYNMVEWVVKTVMLHNCLCFPQFLDVSNFLRIDPIFSIMPILTKFTIIMRKRRNRNRKKSKAPDIS